MKEVRFGIIGCGDVTEVKSGPAFQKIEGSDLSMVMRRDSAKVKDYAHRHKVAKYTTDYKALIQDDSVDAIYIATPPKYHHYYTLEAARAGKPVYVEKPMAMSVDECQEMIDVCKEEGVPLYVAYYRRGQEKFLRAKEMMDQGLIGDIRSFHYVFTGKVPEYNPERAWLLEAEEAGGGMLYDIGSHMVDIITYLFGEVAQASGCSVNQSKVYNVADMTSGWMQFESGVSGTLQLTFNGYDEEDCLTIVGSLGSIKIGIMNLKPIWLSVQGKEEVIEVEQLEHVQQPYIQMVVDSLLGRKEMDTTGTYGLVTQAILEAFKTSGIYRP